MLVRYNALYEQHGVNKVVTYGSISGPFQGTTHLTDATTSEQKSSRKASPSTYDCIAMVRSMLSATCVQSLFKATTSQPDLTVDLGGEVGVSGCRRHEADCREYIFAVVLRDISQRGSNTPSIDAMTHFAHLVIRWQCPSFIDKRRWVDFKGISYSILVLQARIKCMINRT